MQTLFISHRGESADAPENTLQAFRLAMARDTDGMECDIHFTRDHRIVVAHDPHTGRMGDKLVYISETDFEELRKINVRGAFSEHAFVQIPTLAEALEELREGKIFFIEIKPGQDPAILPELWNTLQTSGAAPDQIVIISFDAEILAETKKFMPEYQTLWLTGSIDRQNNRWTPETLGEFLHSIHADGVDIACDETLLTRDFIQDVKAQGFYFAIWTVDGTEQARRFIANGADAITSNKAAALRQQLEG